MTAWIVGAAQRAPLPTLRSHEMDAAIKRGAPKLPRENRASDYRFQNEIFKPPVP
jgi:hypothetical protein